tara:strand:- start:68568 stop:69146 length:579 start_codon:yes stop_codon:yes gene_type:complete
MQNAPTQESIRAVLVHELKKSGISVNEGIGRNDYIHTAGGVRISLASKRADSYWSREDGKARYIRLEVGYADGMNRSYPLRKDDTFNIEKIVRTVGEFEKKKLALDLQRDESDARQRALVDQKHAAALELSDALDVDHVTLETYSKADHSGRRLKMADDVRVGVRTGGKVFINIQGLTAARAVKLMAALGEI